jgi:hypothetical protein
MWLSFLQIREKYLLVFFNIYMCDWYDKRKKKGHGNSESFFCENHMGIYN